MIFVTNVSIYLAFLKLFSCLPLLPSLLFVFSIPAFVGWASLFYCKFGNSGPYREAKESQSSFPCVYFWVSQSCFAFALLIMSRWKQKYIKSFLARHLCVTRSLFKFTPPKFLLYYIIENILKTLMSLEQGQQAEGFPVFVTFYWNTEHLFVYMLFMTTFALMAELSSFDSLKYLLSCPLWKFANPCSRDYEA